MAEEIDESGFYREDFSTESDWEIFIAQLGEVLQKWELSGSDWGPEFGKNQLFDCEWEVQTETLELLKKEITVKYYVAKIKNPEENPKTSETNEPEFYKDLMSTLNSFSATPLSAKVNAMHPLARLYGLRRFVVIHPRILNKQHLTSTSEFSFFLSAANVVCSDICCTVPMFVQIYDPKWNYFIGVGQGPSRRTNFDLVALDQTPGPCRYLSGLLPMFKEKIRLTHIKPAKISVQNIYALDTIRLRIPMYVPFSSLYKYEEDSDDTKKVNLSTKEFIPLPHGYFRDSHTDTFAIYTWPEMAENIALDSSLNSVFVPSKAVKGSIHHVVHSNSYLSSCLGDFLKIRDEKKSLEPYVGRNFSGSSSAAEGANPLDQLTKSKLINLKTKGSYPNREILKKLPGPMNENELQQMMNFLFPDLSDTDVVLFPYPKSFKGKEFDPQRVKSAPPDSLPCRLSSLLATVNSHFGNKSGLAQLWAHFTRDLRFCWDNCLPIPGVASGFPDTRTCLLHQKLQMLNVCIERCAKRQNIVTGKGAASEQAENVKEARGDFDAKDEEDNEEDDENDEFYDCPNIDESTSGDLFKKEPTSEGEMKAEGRLKRLGNLKLLDSDELLYVPITQEPVPKTEDQLQDDAEVMLKLGPGSGLTTQMMCSSLMSDMEAFKAANPNCKIEDFIRWYSPKDWEERVTDEGFVVRSLSERMKAPDNTWQTVWKEAKPVPVSRQKRLFDDTNEALKVLYYLENRTFAEIYELTVIPMLHSAILKLKDILSNSKVLDIFNLQIEELLTDLCHLSRDVITFEEQGAMKNRLPSPERFISKIISLEENFYQYKCFEKISGYPLCSKLEDVKEQFKEILKNGGFYNIINKRGGGSGNLGSTSSSSMMDFKNELRESLISKDYIIRVDGETTSTSITNTGPQFLRAIITGDKLRLCSAFTENTTFI